MVEWQESSVLPPHQLSTWQAFLNYVTYQKDTRIVRDLNATRISSNVFGRQGRYIKYETDSSHFNTKYIMTLIQRESISTVPYNCLLLLRGEGERCALRVIRRRNAM